MCRPQLARIPSLAVVAEPPEIAHLADLANRRHARLSVFRWRLALVVLTQHRTRRAEKHLAELRGPLLHRHAVAVEPPAAIGAPNLGGVGGGCR